MAAKITLYEDINFGGASVEITEAVGDLSRLNFNDKASSAIVGGDEGWQFYSDAYYKGEVYTLSPGSYPTLSFNDTLSSLHPLGRKPSTLEGTCGPVTVSTDGVQVG